MKTCAKKGGKKKKLIENCSNISNYLHKTLLNEAHRPTAAFIINQAYNSWNCIYHTLQN